MFEDAIVEAWDSPRHRGIPAPVPAGTRVATVKNVECGDEVTIAICVVDGIIDLARHEVKGCVLCQAGAELLCQDVTGGAVRLVRAGIAPPTAGLIKSLYGGLPLPNRLSCCELPIRALREALSGK